MCADYTQKEIARFWSKVAKSPGCWLWRGAAINRDGYGGFTRGSASNFRKVSAHRVSYTLAHGPIPDGLNVLHRCDTPACVNPDHLFLGTQIENIRDMIDKGRNRAIRLLGEANHSSKLTADAVRAIRSRYANGGLSKEALAREYNVSRSAIRHVLSGTKWQHVT